ncbi:putative serine/threonine-protein kinase NAK [Hibiscus syriacus]|uniref:non-specific serine/threonine protein kinase n=1 Tax=Hibiscus syriacus TaxID=106335 RepID=A0A6A2XX71_HIBSY|nr:probable serine/threonine-protein kinase PIX13 [Hibiscus syriacus]KAE8658914.1 putative serine/threonine-protein kinase NAK [Hibiscus syriacus]
MGNCFGTQQVDHHSQSTIKPSSPGTSKLKDGKQNSSPPAPDTTKESGSAEGRSKKGEKAAFPASGKILMSITLKIFTLAELKAATRNFKPATVLGEGGFGRVFKGWVDEKTYAPSKVSVGMAVAVKKSNPDSSQGLQEWKAEVNFLGRLSHPNLVKLRGYCWEENQLLLVYEFMQKGSLENHLFRSGGAEPLTWGTRLKIAMGAAQGLTFLHTSEKCVIYRDFKASNILLDGDYNAKLSDFGLAKLGPIDGNSHVTTRVMGTYGYADPEYVATGNLYVKSDVYGFGVVLLEMLTGLRALDTNRPSGKHNLVEWAKYSLTEKRKLKKIMDPKLEGKYPIKAALQAGELILKCLESDPRSRPSMEEVLETLQKINAVNGNSKVSSKASKSKSKANDNRSPMHCKPDSKKQNWFQPDSEKRNWFQSDSEKRNWFQPDSQYRTGIQRHSLSYSDVQRASH